MESTTTQQQNTGARDVAAPNLSTVSIKGDSPSVEIPTHLARTLCAAHDEMLFSMGYLARNVTAALDGDIGNEAANIYSMIADVLGQLTTMRETIESFSPSGGPAICPKCAAKSPEASGPRPVVAKLGELEGLQEEAHERLIDAIAAVQVVCVANDDVRCLDPDGVLRITKLLADALRAVEVSQTVAAGALEAAKS